MNFVCNFAFPWQPRLVISIQIKYNVINNLRWKPSQLWTYVWVPTFAEALPVSRHPGRVEGLVQAHGEWKPNYDEDSKKLQKVIGHGAKGNAEWSEDVTDQKEI